MKSTIGGKYGNAPHWEPARIARRKEFDAVERHAEEQRPFFIGSRQHSNQHRAKPLAVDIGKQPFIGTQRPQRPFHVAQHGKWPKHLKPEPQ